MLQNLIKALRNTVNNNVNGIQFQPVGAFPRSSFNVRNYEFFQNRCVEGTGTIEWPACCTDLSPLDNFYGVISKTIFTKPNMQNQITNEQWSSSVSAFDNRIGQNQLEQGIDF